MFYDNMIKMNCTFVSKRKGYIQSHIESQSYVSSTSFCPNEDLYGLQWAPKQTQIHALYV